jgi:undecaprenyl-diphosphatase
MPLYQVIIYAIVQGLTEFLPVSSSAHLEILPRLFGWTDPGLTFDVALHVGTLIALIAYFFKDWVQIIGNAFGMKIGRDVELERNNKLLWLLIVGTIPIVIVGKIFSEQAENEWRNLYLIGTMLVVIGIVMWLAERVGKHQRDMSGITWLDSAVIGISQALAVVPGTSRSGITIATGLFRNLERAAAARFSFLLSTPAITGAGLLAVLKLRKAGGIPPEMRVPFALGVIVSAVVSAVVIALFMRYLKRATLYPFIYYRIAFGIFVLVFAYMSK